MTNNCLSICENMFQSNYSSKSFNPKMESSSMETLNFICGKYIVPLVCLFGVLGNIINFTILTRRSMRRSSPYTYLLGLAVTDLTVLTLSLIDFSFANFLRRGSFTSAFFNAFIFYPVSNIFSTSSVWITVLLTIERYVSVRFPLKAKELCTKKLAQRAICGVVIISALLNVPRFFGSEVRFCGNNCYEKVSSPFEESVCYGGLTWFYISTVQFIPYLLLIYLNTGLVLTVLRATKQRLSLRGSSHALKFLAPSPRYSSSDLKCTSLQHERRCSAKNQRDECIHRPSLNGGYIPHNFRCRQKRYKQKQVSTDSESSNFDDRRPIRHNQTSQIRPSQILPLDDVCKRECSRKLNYLFSRSENRNKTLKFRKHAEYSLFEFLPSGQNFGSPSDLRRRFSSLDQHTEGDESEPSFQCHPACPHRYQFCQIPQQQQQQQQNSFYSEQMRMTVTCISIICLFLICIIPSGFSNRPIAKALFGRNQSMVEFTRSPFYGQLRTATNLLVYCNLSLNFILYCVFNHRFLVTLKRLINFHLKNATFYCNSCHDVTSGRYDPGFGVNPRNATTAVALFRFLPFESCSLPPVGTTANCHSRVSSSAFNVFDCRRSRQNQRFPQHNYHTLESKSHRQQELIGSPDVVDVTSASCPVDLSFRRSQSADCINGSSDCRSGKPFKRNEEST